MYLNQRKAFTMLELTFVIVIIGILSAIAIPKFAANRDDATITKARTTVASVRNAVSTERQKRILRGSYVAVGDLAVTNGTNQLIFDFYADGNGTVPVLEYPLRSCVDANARGCWISTADTTYVYRMPITGDITFTLANGRFTCDPANGTTGAACKKLTE
jgi:general secretion pathway protein G